MKKLVKSIGVLFFVFSIFSCTSLNMPVGATSNPVGTLVGQSGGTIWFYSFGWVDAGIKKAAENGGITEISTVDFKQHPIGIFGVTYTCTVTGS